ncbi:MAG: transglutaminase domain-containing protein, partial [Firmicutes bacterium]|nr:transglutaminase domain-containing protein [Bacillota bacterium]
DDSYTGSLEQAAAYKESKETRLLVGVSRPGTYYLRGYVGGVYEDGSWNEIDQERYGDYHEGLFAWLSAHNFSPFSQNSDYLRLLMAYNGKDADEMSTSLSVINRDANRKFLYTPYGLTGETVSRLDDFNRDMNVYQKGDSEKDFMTYGVYAYDMSTSLAVMNPAWMKNDDVSNEVKGFKEAQEEYRQFVYDSYLDVPKDIKQFFNDKFDSGDSGNYINMTIDIRNWLADEETAKAGGTSFSAKIDTDYLYYFLGEQRIGNSSFYASAAVMMYRYLGIPARYAEGYLANVSEKDTKGVNKKLTERYQCSLTGEDVHAWVEIYKDGIGWIPVEVTPGYYDDLVIPQDSTQNKKAEDQQQTQPPPQVNPPKQDPPPQEEPNDSGNNGMRIAKFLLMVSIILLVLLMTAMLLRRIIVLRRRKRRLYGDDINIAMRELLQFIKCILSAGGRTEDDIPEEETEILMTYRFRDGIVTHENYERLRDYAYAIQDETYRELNRRGKLKFLVIQVLK